MMERFQILLQKIKQNMKKEIIIIALQGQDTVAMANLNVKGRVS